MSEIMQGRGQNGGRWVQEREKETQEERGELLCSTKLLGSVYKYHLQSMLLIYLRLLTSVLKEKPVFSENLP